MNALELNLVILQGNVRVVPAISIAANVQRCTSSILKSLVAYFIGRKSVGYFGFGKKVV